MIFSRYKLYSLSQRNPSRHLGMTLMINDEEILEHINGFRQIYVQERVSLVRFVTNS